MARTQHRKPRQARSSATVAKILDSAAELLEEVGFDRLTTNHICKRAGITPPALYRYFPNKYAVLEALGERLMAVQNEALFSLIEPSEKALEISYIAMVLKDQYDVTKRLRGAVWIMRSLYATPDLVDVRLKSHELITNLFTELHIARRSSLSLDVVKRRARIVVESAYTAIEMLIDDPKLATDDTFLDVATMIASLVSQE